MDEKNSLEIFDAPNNNVENFVDNSALEDFELARENMISMIKNGTLSIEELTELAKRSQSARMYEVLYSFIVSMSQVNKDLLDIQNKIKELKGMNSSSGMNAKTINQTAIFCGSTAELQKVIKNMNMEKLTDKALKE